MISFIDGHRGVFGVEPICRLQDGASEHRHKRDVCGIPANGDTNKTFNGCKPTGIDQSSAAIEPYIDDSVEILRLLQLPGIV
mgnify:FL=1